MDGLSRRQFVALGAAAGVGASLLPPSLRAAMAEPAQPGGLDSIEHVIVLMQENRSFDHYYGTLRGVRGFGDRNPLTLPDGKPIFRQPKPGGEVLPFSLRAAAEQAGRPNTDIQYLGDLDHSWAGSSAAWAQGWNNGWIAAKTAATMTHYERRDIALQYELADTFTICDAYHCSINGSTNPNRNYLWSGTTGFEPGTTRRAVTNAAYSYDHKGYDWTCYPERLEATGVSWQIYQEWDNFTDNAVEYFSTFKRIGRAVLGSVDGVFRTTEEFYDKLFGRTPAEQETLLAQLAAGRAKLSAADRALFDRGMARSAPESLVPRLRADIAAGTLPRASWLVPSAVDSEHPGASTPVGSASLIYQVLDAIAADPAVWRKTALLINFDENDGFFDHVPPPVPPRPASGSGDDWYDGKPMGLGPRVPMTVVSPWTIGGHVNSEVADHTSVIRFLERWTGVREPNISRWRRDVCGDLTSVFDFRRPGRSPRVTQPGPVPAPISRWRPAPPAAQAMPVQEPGAKPARPLPYQPTVSASLDSAVLRLTLGNSGTRPAHFAVYPYSGEFPYPVHADVSGSHVESVPVPAAGYRLAVQGPNRFWFELAGSADGACAGVSVTTAPIGPAIMRLLLENNGRTDVTLTVRGLAYTSRSTRVRLRAGARRTVPWVTDQGWYDVEVVAEQEAGFRRRITGRIEGGRAGVTG